MIYCFSRSSITEGVWRGAESSVDYLIENLPTEKKNLYLQRVTSFRSSGCECNSSLAGVVVSLKDYKPRVCTLMLSKISKKE